jgi:hypothetical protein
VGGNAVVERVRIIEYDFAPAEHLQAIVGEDALGLSARRGRGGRPPMRAQGREQSHPRWGRPAYAGDCWGRRCGPARRHPAPGPCIPNHPYRMAGKVSQREEEKGEEAVPTVSFAVTSSFGLAAGRFRRGWLGPDCLPLCCRPPALLPRLRGRRCGRVLRRGIRPPHPRCTWNTDHRGP